MSKMINVQDGISPYRMKNYPKINKSYMYLYLVLKSIFPKVFQEKNSYEDSLISKQPCFTVLTIVKNPVIQLIKL